MRKVNVMPWFWMLWGAFSIYMNWPNAIACVLGGTLVGLQIGRISYELE